MSLPQRECTARRPRRTSAPSMMSPVHERSRCGNGKSTTEEFRTADRGVAAQGRGHQQERRGATRFPPPRLDVSPHSGMTRRATRYAGENSC